MIICTLYRLSMFLCSYRKRKSSKKKPIYYVSANSRKSKWGTGAIKIFSEQLRRELPGLRSFSEEGIKKMRTFAEFWHHYLNPSPTATDLENRNTLAILGIEYVTRMQLRGGEASAENFLT